MSSESLGTSSPPASPSPQRVDRTAARYLFAIATLSEGDRVTTGELQEYLGVAPASVTQMVSKLAERGLVDHEKYAGVTLTDDGEAVATRVVRRFCAVTNFFDSVLETTLDEQTAFEIGYQLPEAAVDRLRERTATSCLDRCPDAGTEDSCCPA
jgi:DtxR family Mn-dependent transcriptional regulator